METKNKPVSIFNILDLSWIARKSNMKFNPCFTGDAGVGKSEICQEWVKRQKVRNPEFGFLDIRLAYLEPPDLIGLPKLIEDKMGNTRTTHVLPDFWPIDGEGLILIEEPNRANTSMMNCLMQLLTDRQVGKYKLPDGWMIAACINPENSNYDVNTMDFALRDRFEIYPIGYDFKVFTEFMKEHDWDVRIQSFVKGGLWLYKSPDEIGEDGKYISPRTWSKLNVALKCNVADIQDIFYPTIITELGKNVGREFYKFITNNAPVLAQDFIDDKKKAMKRLEKISDKEGYRGDLINITVESLADNYETTIQDDVIISVCKTIPKDQAVNLIWGCIKKSKDKTKDLAYFVAKDPSLKGILRDSLRG